MFIEHLEVFLMGEEGYNIEMAGKVIFNPNNDPQLNTFDVTLPQNHALMYLYEDTHHYVIRPESVYNPDIKMDPKFSFETYQIMSIDPFLSSHVILENRPVCTHHIPSISSKDPALELYNWPFSLLPAADSCVCPSLGNNPKSAGNCKYAAELDFSGCGFFEEQVEAIIIGTVGNDSEVTLIRGTIKNEYKLDDYVFHSYNEFLDHISNKGLKFEYTYNPVNSEPVDFFASALGRMNKTYAQVKN